MARKPTSNGDERYIDLRFPIAGIDVANGYDRQPTRPAPGGGYARTAAEGVNVRSFEPGTGRARGGSRPGLAKYIATQVNGASALVQGINVVSGVGYSAPGGGVQSSQSGRVVTLVAVSGGTVKVADAGAAAYTAVTNGTGALNATGVIMSAANGQKLWFADGTNYKVYDPETNSVSAWTATAGTLPVDSAGNKPRLICTWRGRTVVSGLVKDPQNIFFSAVSDPTDFDYSPASVTPTQAVAANLSNLGLVGDVVTALIPYSDDVLLIGCDHHFYRLTGDPMLGGQIDLVSDAIGCAWGEAWCKDSSGNVFFMSNRMSVYRLSPGSPPVRISQAIEPLLSAVNTGTKTIRLIWSDRDQGLHVFISTTAAAGSNTHYFFEARSGSWWQDGFANNGHSPLVACTFDGNTATDRVVLIGSWDGYVRYFDQDADDDDGTSIFSSVTLGPILTKDLDDVMFKEAQAVLGTASGDVTFNVHVGATAEAALASTSVLTGTWAGGRNLSTLIRRAGHACYIKLNASTPWAMEVIRCLIGTAGKVRRRGA